MPLLVTCLQNEKTCCKYIFILFLQACAASGVGELRLYLELVTRYYLVTQTSEYVYTYVGDTLMYDAPTRWISKAKNCILQLLQPVRAESSPRSTCTFCHEAFCSMCTNTCRTSTGIPFLLNTSQSMCVYMYIRFIYRRPRPLSWTFFPQPFQHPRLKLLQYTPNDVH